MFCVNNSQKFYFADNQGVSTKLYNKLSLPSALADGEKQENSDWLQPK